MSYSNIIPVIYAQIKDGSPLEAMNAFSQLTCNVTSNDITNASTINLSM